MPLMLGEPGRVVPSASFTTQRSHPGEVRFDNHLILRSQLCASPVGDAVSSTIFRMGSTYAYEYLL